MQLAAHRLDAIDRLHSGVCWAPSCKHQSCIDLVFLFLCPCQNLFHFRIDARHKGFQLGSPMQEHLLLPFKLVRTSEAFSIEEGNLTLRPLTSHGVHELLLALRQVREGRTDHVLEVRRSLLHLLLLLLKLLGQGFDLGSHNLFTLLGFLTGFHHKLQLLPQGRFALLAFLGSLLQLHHRVDQLLRCHLAILLRHYFNFSLMPLEMFSRKCSPTQAKILWSLRIRLIFLTNLAHLSTLHCLDLRSLWCRMQPTEAARSNPMATRRGTKSSKDTSATATRSNNCSATMQKSIDTQSSGSAFS